MNQSTASSLRKLAVGAALACGVAAVSSSTACTVTVSCGPGFVDCGGICVDLANDDFDCGACGFTCSSLDTCVGGQCVPASSCFADGSGCSFDSDCCTGVCSTGDQTCGCVADLSTGCGTDSDCCLSTDSCISGVCQ